MSVDGAAGGCPSVLDRVRRWLGRGGEVADGVPAPRGFLTQEEFHEELAVLGLSDVTFGPREYAQALGDHLGLTVSIDVVPDSAHPLLSRELARKGVTGEILYEDHSARAHVIVPGSLPPLALVFTLLHELGHLASGDLFVGAADDGRAVPRAAGGFPTVEPARRNRLARRPPFARAEHREHEANLRAGYAFVAGCLGSENPYTERMYNIL